MRRAAACFCAALISLNAVSASAEVAFSDGDALFQAQMEAMGLRVGPDFKVTPDLAMMMAKADGNSEARQILQMVLQVGRPRRDAEMLRQQIFGRMGEMRDNSLTKPFRYAAAEQVQDARQRAQLWGQMLAADLNNDGQITKQELKDTLEFMPSDGISDAFFTSDANDDNVLSAEELRAAVDMRSQSRRYGRGGKGIAQMFDFDDDGYLTAVEFKRGAVALGYTVQ